MHDALPDSSLAERWEQAAARRELLLQRCRVCASTQAYLRVLCSTCQSTELDDVAAEGTGTIESFTAIHRQVFAVPVPYIVARVRLAEGPILLTTLVDCRESDLRCDDPVLLDWLEEGDRYIAVFRPAPMPDRAARPGGA